MVVPFAFARLCAASASILAVGVLAVSAHATQEQQPEVDPYEAFARSIEKSVAELDPSVLDGAIDREAWFARALPELDFSDPYLKGVRLGFLWEAKSKLRVGTLICDRLREGEGHYRFLALTHRDGRTSALFRYVHEDQLQYEELELERGDDGATRIVDVRLIDQADSLRSFVRRGALHTLAMTKPEKLEPIHSPATELAEGIKAWGRLMQADSAAKAHEEWNSMREFFAHEAWSRLYQIKFACLEESDQVDALVRRFVEDFPGEPGVHLVVLGISRQQQKFERALAALDRVEKALPPDPYLDVVRGWIQFDSDSLELAQASFARAMERDATLQDAYWGLVGIALVDADFAELERLFRALAERFGFDPAQLRDLKGYEAFVASEEYAALVAERR